MQDTRPEPLWQTLDKHTIHRGRVVLVDHTVRLPDGSTTHYEVDESIPFAVAALVIDGDDILLARQYRHPVGRWIYDLPAGAAEDGEQPDDAVGREIVEELGVIAADLRPLHTFWMNPGRSAWATHIFVGTIDAEPGTVDVSDPAEQVRLARVPLRELDRLIADGEIIDPTLLIARTMAAVRGILPPLGA